jgi:hypothetical protein
MCAMSPRLLRPLTTSHPESIAWRTAVIENGGSVSGATFNAVSRFCREVDAAGLRSKLVRVNLMCGNNLNAALVPLYRADSPIATPLGFATEDNANFVNEDYQENAGLDNSAGTKWLLTGLDQTYADNKHAGAFAHTLSGGVFRTLIGGVFNTVSGVGPEGAFLVGTSSASTTPRLSVSGATAPGSFIEGSSIAAGDFILGSSAASGANQARIFVNGNSQGVGTALDNSFSTHQFGVFRTNERAVDGVLTGPDSGSAGDSSFSARIGGYTIGLNLTDAEVATYSIIWDTLLKALGRR